MADSEVKKVDAGIYFMGLVDQQGDYPAWRYHKYEDPMIVNNTDEDEAAGKKGWRVLNQPRQAVPYMMNWRWDLEDLSPRQLCLYALNEFGVELPKELGKERLIKMIWQLSREAPENEDRIVLMAQTIKMNYDETQDQIRRSLDGRVQGIELTVTEFEFYE